MSEQFVEVIKLMLAEVDSNGNPELQKYCKQFSVQIRPSDSKSEETKTLSEDEVIRDFVLKQTLELKMLLDNTTDDFIRGLIQDMIVDNDRFLYLEINE
jgi:23S rRNA C2498 (ribose-2'-O)-methylase RlmM